MRITGSFARAGIAILIALASIAAAQESDDEPLRGHRIVWQSRNSSQSELSLEFARLYRGLLSLKAEGAVLPTTTVLDTVGESVQKIAENSRLYAGSFFPAELDQLLCMLNIEICSLEAPASSVGHWTNAAGDPIVLPDIQFSEIVVPAPYSKHRGDTLESIVLRDRFGCDDYDGACQRYIQNLNRMNPASLETSYEGEILVPSRAYRAEIKFKELSTRLPEDFRRVTSPQPPEIHGRPQPLPPPEIADLLQSLVLEQLLSAESTDTVGQIGDSNTVRRLIKVPPDLTLPYLAPVAIFDRSIEVQHCDFHEGTTLVRSAADGIARLSDSSLVAEWQKDQGPLPACDTSAQASIARDHGTHILGLLTGLTMGILGPKATKEISAYAFELPRTDFDQPSDVTNLYDTVVGSLSDAAIYVYNFSATYPIAGHTNDVLEQLIIQLSDHTNSLFVAAAGNNSRTFTSRSICDRRPACVDSYNVLSVVAVNLNETNPEILDVSNRGDAFDVAAPGLRLQSDIANNNVGILSGTSQAAAVTSAAALALFSKNRQLPAWRVRNRLIYSSDLFPLLEDNVLGGRLNLERALDFDSAAIFHRSSRYTSPIRGKLLHPEDFVEFYDLSENEPLSIKKQNVFRIVGGAGQGSLSAFVAMPSDIRSLSEPHGVAKVRVSAEIAGDIEILVEDPAALRGSVVKIPLADIIDFVSVI